MSRMISFQCGCDVFSPSLPNSGVPLGFPPVPVFHSLVASLNLFGSGYVVSFLFGFCFSCFRFCLASSFYNLSLFKIFTFVIGYSRDVINNWICSPSSLEVFVLLDASGLSECLAWALICEVYLIRCRRFQLCVLAIGVDGGLFG
ncbi:unnamed protein product [Arabis nemorensis]|uniref:Uncharacterized protein n=1 Tax=Arabis nemorensis TaxID=586526 RepID=A0A565BBW8_9BRAS|nr:unnamed protein product [Arabis nemorensis]